MRVGIIGLGIGESYIKEFQKLGCAVVSVCDINRGVLNMAQAKYGTQVNKYTILEDDIFEDDSISAVAIASYDHHHFDQIAKAYATDKHVFVEKPIVINQRQLEQLQALFIAKPALKISSNLTLRSFLAIKRLKAELSSGDFGDVSFFEAQYNYGRLKKLTSDWRGDIPDYSITIGGGVHMVDLVTWLNDPFQVEQVHAFGNKFFSQKTKFKSYDLVTAHLKFDNGSLAHINMNFGAITPHYHKLEIFGTKKTYIHEHNRDYQFLHRDVKNQNSNHLINDTANFGSYQGKVNFAAEFKRDPDHSNIADFVSAIINNVEPYITKEQIIRSMEICLAIDYSINLEKPVLINLK